MLRADWHVYQVLTKRPSRMRDHLSDPFAFERALKAAAAMRSDASLAAVRLRHGGWPPRHIWLGVSAEDQATVNERIPVLLETSAAVRWLSAEPLLERITVFDLDGPIDVPDGMESPLDWVVCGGESGPGARPMRADWARSLRDQCVMHDVPFFFKQWGGPRPKSHGRVLDGRTWDGMPRPAEAAQ